MLDDKEELLKTWLEVDNILANLDGKRADHEKMKTDFQKIKDYILTSEKIKV